MRQRWVIAVVVIAVAGLGVAAAVLQPWLLLVNVEVADELPAAVETASPEPTPVASSAPPAPAGPVELGSGALISHEHETTGTVRIIEQPDGSRVLTLEGLATSSGPDVHVWLSAAPVVEGVEGWFLAGGQPSVDLGPIKGNLGDQVYEIPADIDLAQYPSVYLWCVQFSVSFGAAAIA